MNKPRAVGAERGFEIDYAIRARSGQGDNSIILPPAQMDCVGGFYFDHSK